MGHDMTGPDEDFEAKCRTALRCWVEGAMPFESVLESLTRLYEQALAENHLLNQATAQRNLGYMQGYRGNVTIAIKHFEQARALYEKLGRDHDVLIMDLNRGVTYRYQGEINWALNSYRRVTKRATELCEYEVQAKSMVNEAALLIQLKRLDEGAQIIRAVHQLADQLYDQKGRNWPTILCEMYFAEALIQVETCHLDDAWNAVIGSMTVAAETGEILHRGYANRTLAVVLDALGSSPDPAYQEGPDHYFTVALSAFREMRAEPEQAQTLYLHGISLGKRGEKQEATHRFQQASVIFSQLGMVYDAAEAARAQRRYG